MKLLSGLLLLVLLAGCEYLPFGQGPLEGQFVANPNDWTEVGKVEIIQLETNGADGPYSVNLWIANIEGTLHVFAGDNLSDWVANIQSDPNVRLGVKGSIYELMATRETSAEQFEKFAQEWKNKYGNRPRNENVDETYLYRLTPRSWSAG